MHPLAQLALREAGRSALRAGSKAAGRTAAGKVLGLVGAGLARRKKKRLSTGKAASVIVKRVLRG